MPSNEMQIVGFGVNGADHAAGSRDVTIKFTGSDLTIQGHKSALAAGSTFFSDHFQRHPSSTKVQAPKSIRPGVNIEPKTVQTALDYLHGSEISEKDIAKNDIPFLLAARVFGILALEDQIKKHLTNKLDRQVERIATEIQIIELVLALRELYGNLSGGGDVEVGREVVGVVASTAAHACGRKFAVFKKSPEFMGLMKEVPMLAYDILASDVEVVAVVKNGDSLAEIGEDVKMGEGSDEVVTEEVEEVVTEIVEEVVTEVVEEVIEEAVEETIEEVVEEAVEPAKE